MTSKIKIPGRDEATSAIEVFGTADAVAKTKADMEKILKFQIGTAPLVVLELDIPSGSFGALIGKGGSTLRDLESKSGCCRIRIPRQTDENQHVVLEGTKEGITKGKSEIDQLLRYTVNVASEQGEAVAPNKKLDLNADICEALFFPDHDGQQGIFAKFLQYLSSPVKSIDICVFTITDDRISGVVEELFRSGLKVRVITDNDTSAQLGSDIDKFRQVGIAVKMDTSPFHMHHKFAILDGKVLVNGSFNWTRQASQENAENVMITSHPKSVAAFKTQFEKMWNDPVNFK